VAEARLLSDNLKHENSSVEDLDKILQSLDAMGYDEAAQYVYGMNYGDWKKRHAQKASDETMQKFNDSKPLWAKHDKEALAKRAETPGSKLETATATAPAAASSSLLSNVCCQDVDEPAKVEPVKKKTSRTRELPPFQPPEPPIVTFSLGILTVSDRASSGEYATGDLSGPAVKDAVSRAVASYGGSVKQTTTETAIVPDDMQAIQSKLKEWADTTKLDLILTTGGTGFSPRDVTPEATLQIVERSCEGLVSFCTMECSKMQPLASLSRGTAGIRGQTLIANLPGNPKGVQEIVPILLPLALHAVSDMWKSN
jgi:molybdopterin adenylyltransferase